LENIWIEKNGESSLERSRLELGCRTRSLTSPENTENALRRVEQKTKESQGGTIPPSTTHVKREKFRNFILFRPRGKSPTNTEVKKITYSMHSAILKTAAVFQKN
jgi:hypothetical protein